VRRFPDGALYLAVLLVASVAQQVAEYLWLNPVVFGASRSAFIVDAVALAIAAVAFARYRPPRSWGNAGLACLATFFAIWVVALLGEIMRGGTISSATFMVPIVLVLVMVKRPTLAATRTAVDAFAWALVAAALLGLVLEMTGVMPSWYPNAEWAQGDRQVYWIPLDGLLGLDGRWAGPFGHPSLTGPVGGFLVVYGFTRAAWRRWVFVGSGVLVLLLAASRSSMMATVLAVGGLAAVHLGRRRPRLGGALALACLLVFVVVSASYLRGDSGLSGRTTVWPVYVTLWQQSPWLGIGTEGISAAIDAGTLPGWARHAHDIWLDAATRTGLLGLALVVALFVQAMVAAVRAAVRGEAAAIGILLMLVFAGVNDTLVYWLRPTSIMMMLVSAVLLALTAGERRRSAADEVALEDEPLRGS
jgi:hypothetical protein